MSDHLLFVKLRAQLDLVKVMAYRENLSGSADDTNPARPMEDNAIRIPIVGVMGSGTQSHYERASRLGRWLALEGVHLLTGGGSGVMTSVSQAFYETPDRRGLVIGIIPSIEGSFAPKAGYPNKWVEIPIFTHLAMTGKKRNGASFQESYQRAERRRHHRDARERRNAKRGRVGTGLWAIGCRVSRIEKRNSRAATRSSNLQSTGGCPRVRQKKAQLLGSRSHKKRLT